MGRDPSPRNASTAEDQLRKTAAMEMPEAKAAKPRNSLKIRRCVSSSIKSLPAHKNDRGAEPCIVGRHRTFQNLVGLGSASIQVRFPKCAVTWNPSAVSARSPGWLPQDQRPAQTDGGLRSELQPRFQIWNWIRWFPIIPIKPWLFVIQNAIHLLTKSPKRAWQSQEWDASPPNTGLERAALRGVALDLPYADGSYFRFHS